MSTAALVDAQHWTQPPSAINLVRGFIRHAVPRTIGRLSPALLDERTSIYANTLLITAHITSSWWWRSAFRIWDRLSSPTPCASIRKRSGTRGKSGACSVISPTTPTFSPNARSGFCGACSCSFFFGREVEQYAGRKVYLTLYAALVLIPAILLCLLGLFISTAPHLNCF